jgi:predicted nucleic acid-binding protein
LSIKLRTGAIKPSQRDVAIAAFNALAAESLTMLEVRTEHFRMAASFADAHETGLRASDALHLAIASGSAARLYTLDRRLAAAGALLGVETQRL